MIIPWEEKQEVYKCLACNADTKDDLHTIVIWNDTKYSRVHLELCKKCNKEVLEKINDFMKEKKGLK